MIPYFDKFIDTREKRYHLLLILVLTIALLLLLSYLFLGIQLSFLNTYDSLYELLEKPYIEWTYISRVIADFISIATASIPNILQCLLSNLGVVEVLAIVLFVLSIGILERKKYTTICLTILVVEVLICCALAYMSLKAGSLLPVIANIKHMGIIMLFCNGIVGILVVYHLYFQIKYYYIAYRYEVIEEKEPVY